ncbi:polysaccharide deacetylase family protein [Emcibacter sp. SYSU 3D8]|uniref:polysaccharide deacetylase family protein n=1 Tax=Emcibacter sp. SYSU 3D8 TaxID=3133969 RepID=UPI0031FF3C32
MTDFERCVLRLPATAAPALMVVIDTEEEFDWSRPFARSGYSLEALAELGRAQELFEEFGIVPVYAVDYPVADNPDRTEALRGWVAAGRAVLAAQLHGWVTPPFDEPVSRTNSYQGNLPPALERAKLEALVARVTDSFGIQPVIHKAGRYGIGPATPGIIADLGFEIDLSICPSFDGRRDGGPDHTRYLADPFRFGPGGRLLELPSTAGYCGMLSPIGNPLHGVVASAPLERARLKAAFSRLGLLERIRLSPEGHPLSDLKRLTRKLLVNGTRVLTFSFHSPSLRPGCTPYVKDESDRARLLRTCRDYFQFFRDELGGRFATPLEVRDALS